MSDIMGAIIIARNGDRTECYQDPITQETGPTASTPLGEVEAFQLGQYLRNLYLDANSSSHIRGIHSDLVDLQEVHVRVKVGGEGSAVFDSATALLQGLFPPNPNNKVTLANETTVTAPLNGYQYIPFEMVDPTNDRSLEPWVNCPAFQAHVVEVQASVAFKAVAQEAQPFFRAAKDYVFGRPLTLENAWNIFDFISSQSLHNNTYADHLPPTILAQARGFADYRENAIYSDTSMGGIGNIASRTALGAILSALQRIAFNGDPLQLMVIETTYQPFISFFNEVGAVDSQPELKAIPDFGSALAIELRRGAPPDLRDFLRFKFRNGTDQDFGEVHVFGHSADIPLTEFIDRVEGSVINSTLEWSLVCSTPPLIAAREILPESATIGRTVMDGASIVILLTPVMLLLALVAVKFVAHTKHGVRVRLEAGPGESPSAGLLESEVQLRS